MDVLLNEVSVDALSALGNVSIPKEAPRAVLKVER
jgi:hypothetical protein